MRIFKMQKSKLNYFLTLLIFLFALPCYAQLAAWPTQSIKIIAPFAPGSATDIWARILAQGLQERLGKPVVVENKTGAGGQIGTDIVAKAPPNGYTLLIAGPPTSIQVNLFRGKLPYDFQKDFVPVSLLATFPLVLVVGKGTEATTFNQLIQEAKNKPGSLSFGSSGNGSSNQLTAELMGILTQTSFTHVPYRGTSAVYPDLIGGTTTMLFDNVTVAQPQIKSGTVRALVVTSLNRSKALPNIPSSKELGLPELVASSWTAVFVRAGTSPDIIKRLNTEINSILSDKQLRERMETQGAELHFGGPEVLLDFFNADVERFGKVIKQANIKAE